MKFETQFLGVLCHLHYHNSRDNLEMHVVSLFLKAFWLSFFQAGLLLSSRIILKVILGGHGCQLIHPNLCSTVVFTTMLTFSIMLLEGFLAENIRHVNALSIM
jgi:hypothetical protein